MADILLAAPKTSKKKAGFNTISDLTTSDETLRIENYINQLYDLYASNSHSTNRSIQSKLFELIKNHRKTISKLKK
ncbi:hypothetical protein [Pedobacter gandavensis]|uniref:hypothetical protein n=1 Tax=Pedobacter gandavensis TaxID=2679963 RepID=UPI00292E73A2|nr:hypothetical protein [Pedobacter gandavensis]